MEADVETESNLSNSWAELNLFGLNVHGFRHSRWQSDDVCLGYSLSQRNFMTGTNNHGGRFRISLSIGLKNTQTGCFPPRNFYKVQANIVSLDWGCGPLKEHYLMWGKRMRDDRFNISLSGNC